MYIVKNLQCTTTKFAKNIDKNNLMCYNDYAKRNFNNKKPIRYVYFISIKIQMLYFCIYLMGNVKILFGDNWSLCVFYASTPVGAFFYVLND